MADIYGDDIGKNIREIRDGKGITRADLGASVGVTGQAIYQYESGKRALKFEMIEKIATALDVPVDTLLGSQNFVSGKSKKVKPLPLTWATVLNLKDLLLPNNKKDTEMEKILNNYDVQMCLYGLFVKLKKLNETDRYMFLQLINKLIDSNRSIDDLESISIVSSRLYSLNQDGLKHTTHLIEDVSELPKYRIQDKRDDE